ncbi:ABC transporter permease [Ornithinicoccus hortensis]|uniref:Glycine betaine/proline transport system permease protein n=1 Tax=Ornithinicoccus hortensis TaxID=82346 RepID=A0A542YTE6_9MICO|nr:proline/glycine betaine ABC transporter permease [Ornithinicoccus hortensis]TQL51366.1 glycine betaine/proline transport system permease protein [Ornithinicoccus hortensis]
MTRLPTVEFVDAGIPRIPLGAWIDTGFDWVKANFRDFFRAIADVIETSVETLADALTAPPALVVVVILALLAWLVKDWKLGIGSLIGLAAVVGMDQWDNAMLTLSLVLIATLIALVIGIPLGIAAARWRRVSALVRPVMDLMQTMPGFVWLVPVVTLFGIAVPAGMVATIIFALPPAVRLTELGIRQVDAEVVEAGHAFGGTPRQILRGIQLPLAMPTVMAGVNQVIMLALSMAVIAGLVGAPGLGAEVISAISTLNIGLGFEAGLSVVALAIYLDRLTASVGGGSLARLRRRRPIRADAAQQTEADLEEDPAGRPSAGVHT